MAARMKASGLGAMHTAGIYSDMTVDGPEIGTLVVIVDRAKNLPNRKTIGKQNPYCAARLGKEAKKTDTDHRGGQTPRWDQELRFTVHDSADYYQLKVSVFNDDKRTDLIGETWVNLQEVVVPGGGQNDIWHTLTCKSKYAGEVRIEITYYDTRPKQERPEKAKQGAANGVDTGGRDSLKGPRQPKAAVKRRPLPSDPISGAPAPIPTAVPDHIQTPPRGYQAVVEAPEHVHPSPRGYPSTNGSESVQTTPQRYEAPHAMPDQVHTRPRASPVAIPDHAQTPPRGHQSPSYVPNQSPLQNVEYNTTPSQFAPASHEIRPNINGYASSSPDARPVYHERNEIHDPIARSEVDDNSTSRYDEGGLAANHRGVYNSQYTPYDLPPPEDFGPPPSPGGPPPPPPAHRSKYGTGHIGSLPTRPSHGSYGHPRDSASSKPYASSTSYTHRHSIPAYSQSQSYIAGAPTGDKDPFHTSAGSNDYYHESPPRHHSYDGRYNSDYGSMQPTVEDAPPSPSGERLSGNKGSGLRSLGYDGRGYDEAASPAPLNLGGRGSSPADRIATSSTPSTQYSNSIGYTSSNSRLSMREQSYVGTSVSSRTSYGTLPQPNHQIPRKPSNAEINQPSGDYGLPPVPATLVAGMDPLIAQELSDRIYEEKRAGLSQNGGRSSGGRHNEPTNYQQSQPRPQSYQEASRPLAHNATASYDERQSRLVTPAVPATNPRGISPDHRTPARKSVSPSPGPSESRLPGIPFGPDSYDALNPNISGSTSAPSPSSRYDLNEPDTDAKIITHDGREIDPSDHIPESNYAPLLEHKGPKYASQLPDRNYRPASGPNPQPSSGRRQLKQAARPQSMAAPSSSPGYSGSADPMTPQSGRNRLQKKANRMSAMPAPHSSPLAPVSPYQNNSHAPGSGPRPHTGDYGANENYAQSYSPGYSGGSGPPPIPAKVPIHMQSAPPPQATDGHAWALLEEMKSIDLGSGRARRRGY